MASCIVSFVQLFVVPLRRGYRCLSGRKVRQIAGLSGRDIEKVPKARVISPAFVVNSPRSPDFQLEHGYFTQ